MIWFRENRFLGAFLILFSACTVVAVWFLLSARSEWKNAVSRFDLAATELNRLERLAPYPSEENLRKMKTEAGDYATALERLKSELKAHASPLASMAPNEFQSRLRSGVTAVLGKARANNVKLPDKFYLGFDEFASALPSEVAAPPLGQELTQIEWLFNALFEARVEALTSFRRIPLPEERGATPRSSTSTPAARPGAIANPIVLGRNVVEATFVSTSAAARKVLNQIAGSDEHFFVVRLLHVRNEKDKGPPREVAADTTSIVAASPAGSPATPGSLSFIVGNERVETSMRVEMVRFTF